MLAGLALLLTSCGGNSGVGLFGDYNGRLDFATKDVAAGRQQARLIVEEGHQGRLEKEETSFPPRFLGLFAGDPQAVMTFRVPARQFDSTMVDLDTPSVGTVTNRVVTGRDDIERRSDLSEISQILNDRLDEVVDQNGDDEDVIDAQEQLAELAEQSNRPVLVVTLQPGRGLGGWFSVLFFNRLVWLILGLMVGFAFGHKKGEPKVSPVYGKDDDRQNSPEKNPDVNDWGEPA
jgi:hypothetical protein